MQNSDESVSFQSRVAVMVLSSSHALPSHPPRVGISKNHYLFKGTMYPHCLRAYRGRTVAHKTAMSIYDPSPSRRYRVLSLIIVNKVELMLDHQEISEPG